MVNFSSSQRHTPNPQDSERFLPVKTSTATVRHSDSDPLSRRWDQQPQSDTAFIAARSLLERLDPQSNTVQVQNTVRQAGHPQKIRLPLHLAGVAHPAISAQPPSHPGHPELDTKWPRLVDSHQHSLQPASTAPHRNGTAELPTTWS